MVKGKDISVFFLHDWLRALAVLGGLPKGLNLKSGGVSFGGGSVTKPNFHLCSTDS